MMNIDLTGYLSGQYAGAFSEWGKPLRLPRSKSWVLRRSIPDTEYHDAMGLYPLMCCRDWDGLREDMGCLYNLVSLVFVADPFADLGDTFWLDLHIPYKSHHIVDYGKDWKPSKHHRYYARKAKCKVELTLDPNLETWCELYSTLTKRHNISGISAFSKRSFRQQLETPGLITFQAYDKTGILGMHLWYVQGNIAYSHLAAYSDRGYEVFAAYGLMDAALKFFAGNVKFLDIGSTADGGKTGLDFFKKGWSNDSREAYLCGKILRPDVYEELMNDEKSYFPAYRG